MSADEDLLEPFIAFSRRVTAFDTVHLYGTGLAQDYLRTVRAVVGDALLQDLLAADAAVAAQAGDDDRRLAAGLRARVFSDDRLGPVARNICKLWYLGTWYALPVQWHEDHGTGGEDGTFVVSPAAYTEGLVWPAIGANPPGAKGPGYATWTDRPQIAHV